MYFYYSVFTFILGIICILCLMCGLGCRLCKDENLSYNFFNEV